MPEFEGEVEVATSFEPNLSDIGVRRPRMMRDVLSTNKRIFSAILLHAHYIVSNLSLIIKKSRRQDKKTLYCDNLGQIFLETLLLFSFTINGLLSSQMFP